MPIVHVMRHGHVHNPDKVLYGRLPNFRLSPVGDQMAHATATYLADHGHHVGRVVSSPLLRAQQTAAHVAAVFALDVATDDRLIEAANDYEGEPLQSGPKDFAHPRHWWRLRNPMRPSWGEPYVDQRKRMWAAIMDAAAANPDSETVMVSHQLPIWVARLDFENRAFFHDPRSRECGLASLTSYEIVDGEAVAMEYTEPAAHIEVPT
jgi:broad specificity phosphatase PhoE